MIQPEELCRFPE